MKKLSKIISLCLLIIMLTNTAALGEININEGIKGAVLGDLATGEILYEYNKDQQVAIASITKLMTYLLMMEAVDAGKVSLDDDVVISGHAASTEGSRLGLVKGETVKLGILAQGLLVISGNDAATAIAEHVAGTEADFVKLMNQKAGELGLMSASYLNSHGYPINDEESGQNHMSTGDIYKLVRYILNKYPQILEITSQSRLVIPERNLSKASTNPLMGVVEGIDGLKTGYTDRSGLCLVSTKPVTGSNGEEFRLIAIVMGAQTHDDRLNKSKELLDYGVNNFSYQKLSDKEMHMDQVYMASAKDGRVDVYPSEDYHKLIKNEDKVRIEIKYDERVSAPMDKGQKIGTITVYINDKETHTIDAVVNQNIKKANIFVRMFRFLKGLFGF